MPRLTKYTVRRTKDEPLSEKNKRTILFFDPVKQLQSLLSNPDISSKLLMESKFVPNGRRSDVTTGSKFHSVFNQAIKDGKIPLMGKVKFIIKNCSVIHNRRDLLG